MATPTPPVHGLFALWSAHRELSGLEWLEFQRAVLVGLGWGLCAGVTGLTSWLALNAAAILALGGHPAHATLAVAGANALVMVLAGWLARQHLWQPFFGLTQREVARDLGTLVATAMGSRSGLTEEEHA